MHYRIEIGRPVPDIGPAYFQEECEALSPERATRIALLRHPEIVGIVTSVSAIAIAEESSAMSYWARYVVPPIERSAAHPQPAAELGEIRYLERTSPDRYTPESLRAAMREDAEILRAVRQFYGLPEQTRLELYWHRCPGNDAYSCSLRQTLPTCAGTGEGAPSDDITMVVRRRADAAQERGYYYHVAEEATL